MRSHRRQPAKFEYVLPTSPTKHYLVASYATPALNRRGLMVASQHKNQQNGIYEVRPVRYPSPRPIECSATDMLTVTTVLSGPQAGFHMVRKSSCQPPDDATHLGADGKPIYVLLTDQPNSADNGVYTVTSAT